jgi:hypothetical protein
LQARSHPGQVIGGATVIAKDFPLARDFAHSLLAALSRVGPPEACDDGPLDGANGGSVLALGNALQTVVLGAVQMRREALGRS